MDQKDNLSKAPKSHSSENLNKMFLWKTPKSHSSENLNKRFISSQKKISKQYMKPKIYAYDPKRFKKYFGKKAAYIEKASKLLSSSIIYKYFKSICFVGEFLDKERLILKYRPVIKSQCGQVILKIKEELNQKDFISMISRMKPFVKIATCNYLKYWLKTPNKIRACINHLNLKSVNSSNKWTNPEKESKMQAYRKQRENEGGYKYYDSFQTEKPQDRNSNHTYLYRGGIRSYFPEEINIHALLESFKRLDILQVDFKGMNISDQNNIYLLTKINQSKVSRWFIQVDFGPNYFKDTTDLAPILKKIDFLGLHYEQGEFSSEFDMRSPNNSYDSCYNDQLARYKEEITEYYTETRPFAYSTPNLSEMKDLIQNRKKVLEIYIYSGDEAVIDAFGILNYCKSLRGLYIKAVGDPFQNEIEPEDWAKNLQNVVLCFNYLNDDKKECFEDVYYSLLEKSKRLKTLELFKCKTSAMVYLERDHVLDKDIYSSIDDYYHHLKDFTNLEELKITVRFLDMVKEFEKFQHLKKLTINFSNWDFYNETTFDEILRLRKCLPTTEIIITENNKSAILFPALKKSLKSYKKKVS